MRKLFQRFPLRTRILGGELVLLMLMLLPSISVYQRLVQDMWNSQVAYMNQLNDQTDLNVTLLFSPLDRINFLQYSDGRMRTILMSDASEKSASEEFEDDSYLRNALNHTLRGSSFILRGGIVTANGAVYCSQVTDNSSYRAYVAGLLEDVSWGEKNDAHYTGVHTALIQQSQREVVTMLQRLYYYDAFIGVICVDMSYETLSSRFNETYASDAVSSLCVLEEDGILYNSPGAGLTIDQLSEEDFSVLRQAAEDILNNGGICQVSLCGRTYLLTAVQNDVTGWYLIQYVPVDVLNQLGFQGLESILLIFVIVLAVAVAFSVFLSRMTIKPLEDMISSIQLTQKGHLKLLVIPEEFKKTEVGSIMRSYNLMARRINDGIDATYLYELNQKRMELKMLRYQINPHFIYNTLNTISAMAELEEVPQISRVILSLSDILRYNVKGGDVVPLMDEISYVRNYLQIQNARFPGRFRMEINVSPEARDAYMLKFLIQPILENSFAHGLFDKRTGGLVQVEALAQGEDLYLSVYDNGSGMAPEALEEWDRRLRQGERENPEDESIGLINVNCRIRSFYGREYGMRIESEEGRFTRVTLHLKKLPKPGTAAEPLPEEKPDESEERL